MYFKLQVDTYLCNEYFQQQDGVRWIDTNILQCKIYVFLIYFGQQQISTVWHRGVRLIRQYNTRRNSVLVLVFTWVFFDNKKTI